MQPVGYFEESDFMLLILPFMQYDLKAYMRSPSVPRYIRRKQVK